MKPSKARQNWRMTLGFKPQLVIAFAGGLILAAATSLFRTDKTDSEPAVGISVGDGEALGATDTAAGVPFAFDVPEKERTRVAIELKLVEGDAAIATVILLNATRTASAHEIKLEKGKWIAWSATGDYHRVLVDVRPPSAALPNCGSRIGTRTRR